MDIEEIDCEQEGYVTFRTLIKDTGDWHQQGISPTSVRKVLTGTEFGRERNHGYRTWTVDCKITDRSDGRKYFG